MFKKNYIIFILFFIGILVYLIQMFKKLINYENIFVFTVLLIFIFGCLVQNFISNLYFGIILSFLLNYNYQLQKK